MIAAAGLWPGDNIEDVGAVDVGDKHAVANVIATTVVEIGVIKNYRCSFDEWRQIGR